MGQKIIAEPLTRTGYPYDVCSINRDVLPIPEVYIEDSHINFHSILRPIFDSLWNTCGYERCLHYDNIDNYKPL